MVDQFRIEFDDKAVLTALRRAEEGARDLGPLMEQLAGILEDASERAFKQERDPTTGAPWAALSPVTQNKEVAEGKLRGAHPILQVSGSLVLSMRSEHDATSATVGFAEKYASTQHHGAKKGEFGRTRRGAPIPWGDIPARQIVGIGESDQTETLDAVSQYISSAFE